MIPESEMEELKHKSRIVAKATPEQIKDWRASKEFEREFAFLHCLMMFPV